MAQTECSPTGEQFQFVNERVDQPTAKKNCNSLGGALASISSLEEYDTITDLVVSVLRSSDVRTGGYWVGK